MPNISQTIAILLAASLALVSCSSNPPQSAKTTINVAVVMYPGGGAPPQTLALYKGALEVTKAASSDYQLNMVSVTPSVEAFKGGIQPTGVPPTVSALEQALSQDPPPDVVFFNSTFEFTGAIGKEMLLDLDQYMRGDKGAPKEDYYSGALEAVSDGGRVYGLPVSGGPTVLQFDKRLFDAAGLPAPAPNWTWSEFVDVARRLTKATGDPQSDQYALNLMMGPNILPAFIWQNAGEIVSKDGLRALVAEPAAVEAIKFYDDLTNSYKVAAPFPKARGEQAPPMSVKAAPAMPAGPNQAPPMMGPSGRVAMSFATSAGSFGGSYWSMTQGDERPIRLAELPRGKVAATILDLQAVVAVTAKARNPRLAYKAAVALVTEMQKETAVPMRRSAAKNLRRISPSLAEDDAQVILNALEYARPMPFNNDQKVLRPFYEKLIQALLQGTKTPAEAAKEAAEAIDQALNE